MTTSLRFASLSFATLIGCVGADPAVERDDVADGEHTSTVPIAIPGTSADFRVIQTSAHTFVLHGYANAVLVDVGGELALIDTLAPGHISPTDLPNLQATVAFLASTGKVSSSKVRYIVNTHWHPDHVGNTGALRAADTEVIAGRGGIVRMSTPQHIAYFHAELPEWPAAWWPSREVASNLTVRDMLQISYAPYSHTTTDLVIRMPKEKVVVVGDLIIGGANAFTDHDNGGSMRGLLLSLENILGTLPADHLVIPGHYEVMTKAEARAWGDAVRAGLRYVDAKLAAGASLAEIQAAAALPPEQGGAPAATQGLAGDVITLPAFVEFTYRDLTERDVKALIASRVLARLKTVDTLAMVAAITASTLGGEAAAGTEYDTLAFEVGELEAVGNTLTAGAKAAMAVYDRHVATAREQGRTDLTAAEYQAMLLELARL
jgi:glyoxylase-like metal-dependent hydrolase (beta-lactamase superfamily II)